MNSRSIARAIAELILVSLVLVMAITWYANLTTTMMGPPSFIRPPEIMGVEGRPILHELNLEDIPGPYQQPYSGEKIIIPSSLADYELTPVASYRIAAVVVGRQDYGSSDDGDLSPMDAALVWGKLASADMRKGIAYSMCHRCYTFYSDGSNPLGSGYASSHGANTHLVPSSWNIKSGISAMKVGSVVEFEGYLVNVRQDFGSSIKTMATSLSRHDSGPGSCEILYIKKAIVDGQLYE